MASDKSVEIAIYAVVGGGALVATGFKRFLTVRKTQDTATSKIASAPQGFVEIQGYAWHDVAIKTNIEGRKCVYYTIELQKLVKSGKNSRWKTVATHSLTQTFFIIDETGAVTVQPEKFDFNIQKLESNWNKIPLNVREKLLEKFSAITNDVPSLSNSGLFSSSYRCVESYILLGSPIIAHGRLDHSQSLEKQDFNPSLYSFYSNILRYKRDKRRALTFLDHNNDGEINEDELRIGMHATAVSSIKNSNAHAEGGELKFFGILGSHPEHKSFIADCHQPHLIKRMGSWNTLMIIGGVGLILAGIWIIMLTHF